jgi:hypothetical protein
MFDFESDAKMHRTPKAHRDKKPAGAELVSQIFVSGTLTKNFATNGISG